MYPHYFTLHLLVLLCSCWSNHPISPHQAMALLDLAEEVEALRLAEKVRTPLRALNMSKTTSFFREEHAINHHHIYIYIYIYYIFCKRNTCGYRMSCQGAQQLSTSIFFKEI